jgi:c-di-AMP phosphodiesterase-like protein
MKKVSSKSCFSLAIIFASISIIWFVTVSFSNGLIMAIVAFLELVLGIYHKHKEKNDGR